ncbi:MAG: DUF4347 domain-containing protein [Cyanobacteria bacterium J06634_5]
MTVSTILPRPAASQQAMRLGKKASTQLSGHALDGVLVVIDPGVADSQELAAGVLPGVQAIVLDPQQSATDQITAKIKTLSTPLASLHLVAHGSPGALHFTNGELSLSTLAQHTDAIKTWFAQTTEAPELLLYGCNLASKEAGEEFLSKLQQLTQATVRASKSRVGSETQQGSWALASVQTSCGLHQQTQAAPQAFQAACLAAYSSTFLIGDINVTEVRGLSEDGNYVTGDAVDIVVRFSATVNVNGTPQLKLETGAIDRAANYISGTGTNALTFRYVVKAGDRTDDLDYLSATALLLSNGSTITSNVPVDLTLPAPLSNGALSARSAIVINGPSSGGAITPPDTTPPDTTPPDTTPPTATAKLVPESNNLIKVDSGSATQLKATITAQSNSEVGEIIAIATDDASGTIDGNAPGSAGYLAAALEKATTVFSVLEAGEFSDLGVERVLDTIGSDFFQFAAIQGGTLGDILAGGSGTVAFATAAANSNNQAVIVPIQLDESTLQLDFQPVGSSDFGNVSLQLSLGDAARAVGASQQGKAADSEILDFTGFTGTVEATIEVLREAAFNNTVGFYQIEDTSGSVRDPLTGNLLAPGDAGYQAAALANRVELSLSGSNGSSTSYSAQLNAGNLLSTFLVVDGSVEALIDANGANDPTVYFNYLGANSDGKDHVRLLGDNVFGYEDLAGGGDSDFNDVIVKMSFTPNNNVT